MVRGEPEENPWSRDDLKVVYQCDGAPEECYNCTDAHRCNYVLEFGLERKRPLWMLHLAVDMLRHNMRCEARDTLSEYLSIVDHEYSRAKEDMLRGITEGMPQTADLWKGLLVVFDSCERLHEEERILLQEAVSLFPSDVGLLSAFYRTEGCLI